MKQNRKNWFSLFGVIMMLLFMAMIGEAKKASDSFPEIALEPVISGLNKPLNLVASPDGTGRLFVEEQEGKIKVWQGGRV
ncbi:MAG TPA: hypothetical protein VFA15_09395, partial [Nitrososphaera sp.]|nr:hypothetical protein [Nitrososphaera sp.]